MSKKRSLAIALALVLGSATWTFAQSTGGSLTAQDYAEIQQLYARYNFIIDAGDAEGYAALYTPDGSFNTFSGRDGLLTFMKGRTAQNQRHWNTNLMITPSPEGASGAVYLMLIDVGVNPPVIRTAAKYADVLVKTPQGWRFKKRQTSRDGVPPATSAAPAPSAPRP